MTDASKPVQVASIQTLQRRAIPPFDLVVVDEAHRWFEMLGVWMADPAWQRVPFVGLSATPWTKGLGKFYDDLIQVTTTAELIEAGYLSPFRVYAPSHPDLSEVRTVAGDYHEGDLGEAMNQATLVADIVQTWLRRGENRPTFIFAVDRPHAKHLQAQFQAAGVATGYIDAYTGSEEREALFRQFTRGELKAIASVGCLTTGVDLDVRCIVLARPTKSEMLFVQIIGRGLRTAPGKADCLILDHSDTHLRLGFVTDIHHDRLDDGRERQKRDARERPDPCRRSAPRAASSSRRRSMPARPAASSRRSRARSVARTASSSRCGRSRRGPKTFEKANLFGQLKLVGRRRGYSSGWAANQFRELTGVWPNHYRDAPEVEPTPEILGWVKSRAIAFARKREVHHVQAAE